MHSLLIAACLLSVACGQVYFANQHVAAAPILNVAPARRDLSHRAVVANSQWESTLPQELINPFYKDPRVAAGLAKESWFGDKEFPIFNREAEDIPRERVFKILRNAGLARRRR